MKKAYPTYKETEIPWAKRIPESWKTIRYKYLFREINERSETGEEDLLSVSQYTGVTLRRDRLEDERDNLTNAASLEGYKKVERDDLVTNIMLAWNGSLGISPYEGIVSPAYCIYRGNERVFPQYFHYLLRTDYSKGDFKKVSSGVIESRLRMYTDDFFALYTILPPISEQRQIAAYLDHKCALIDTFIAKKKRLIELLQEQKQAIINQAVTRGIDPDVPLKPSGVDWLGDVPAHWGAVELRRLLEKIEQGWSPLCENRHADENEWGVMKVGCVNGLVFNPDEHKALPANLEPKQKYEINSGDVIMSRANTRELLGSTSLVKSIRPRLLLCDKLYRLHFRDRVNSEFLVYSLRNHSTKVQIESAATGASDSMQNISQGKVLSLWLALPPKHEQERIVGYINKELNRISITENKIETELRLIQEYKTTLIAEAVTGKIDVRDWKPEKER
jgi:type I restriction enzyme S subunit